MTTIPHDHEKDLDFGNQGSLLLPEGQHVVTVISASKNKDKYDANKEREIVILRVKVQGHRDVFPIYLRIPISWSIPGTTEQMMAPKIHGRNLVNMLEIIGKFKPGEELNVKELEGHMFTLVIKHSEPNRQGKVYANLSKISAAPAQAAPPQPEPPTDINSDGDPEVPF